MPPSLRQRRQRFSFANEPFWRFGDSPMALTSTPLGVTAGSLWRQPWGWESLLSEAPAGRFLREKTGHATGANGLDLHISHGLQSGGW